jgi:hypothetical protein
MTIDFDGLVLGPAMDVFGEDVVYVPATAPSSVVRGIFDEYFREVTFDNEGPVSTQRPTLSTRAAFFPLQLPVSGELFRIRGATWCVADVRPDGMGELKIALTRT